MFCLSSEGTEEIDLAILSALLKAQARSHSDQLSLALAWDRADIANQQIFVHGRDWAVSQLNITYRLIYTLFISLTASKLSASMGQGGYRQTADICAWEPWEGLGRKSAICFIIDRRFHGTLLEIWVNQ